MKSPLAAILGAVLLAAAPAGAAAPADPLNFEISRDGQVLWRAALVPAPIPSADFLGAELPFDTVCAGAPGRSRFAVSIQVPLETPEIRMGDEYLYSFSWSRPFDPEPRRLDACAEPNGLGMRSSSQSGAFHLGRSGRISFPLQDDLTITFYR
jgi:hypothetical protein